MIYFNWQLADLQENYSKLVAGAKIAQTQMEAMQTSRPKSARPKTPQVKKKKCLLPINLILNVSMVCGENDG